MINLTVKQDWLEKSSDAALEEFKSALVTVLNNVEADRHVDSRWSITKVSEGDEAYLMCDEKPVASLKIENNMLGISSDNQLSRYDDIVYSIRYVAQRLSLAVYSNKHEGARLPINASLSLDHSFFDRDKAVREFFEKSDFVPRYAYEGVEQADDIKTLRVYAPFYVEHKENGTIHILNNAMLDFLLKKDDQRTNREFSYRVADSMDNFALKHDLGLIPVSFYRQYGVSTKIINDTQFDIWHISRKVFIDPYLYDFDDKNNWRFFGDVVKGIHLMDKVRKGENLEEAIERMLEEEFRVSGEFVGAKVWNVEFDRDRDGLLTPRLMINIYVRGLNEKRRRQSHDWASIQ